jgi:peptidoglycan/LPS O-acetylase OafA/YrhL
MVIAITQPITSTYILIAGLGALIAASVQPRQDSTLLSPAVSQELKGLAILAILFAHVGLFLAHDQRFLFPLSVMAGVGVDLFLFLSGYGLAVGLWRQPLAPTSFYRRRLMRVFVPFWIVLGIWFVADALFLHRTYDWSYVARSVAGIFPSADLDRDVNSVFWYITWIAFYYALFPWLFMRNRLWLTALALALAGILGVTLALDFFAPVLHLYALHTLALPLGVLAAWALLDDGQRPSRLRVALTFLRDDSTQPWRALALCGLLGMACFAAWRSGVNHGVVVEQAVSLLTMTTFLIFFMLKRFDIRWLSLAGLYSYEIYLLHWPLVSRYDWLYHHVSGWLATAIYLALLLLLGWCMQRGLAALRPQRHQSQ